jgi:hypothetical protein
LGESVDELVRNDADLRIYAGQCPAAREETDGSDEAYASLRSDTWAAGAV